jgi:hypothetical protein
LSEGIYPRRSTKIHEDVSFLNSVSFRTTLRHFLAFLARFCGSTFTAETQRALRTAKDLAARDSARGQELSACGGIAPPQVASFSVCSASLRWIFLVAALLLQVFRGYKPVCRPQRAFFTTEYTECAEVRSLDLLAMAQSFLVPLRVLRGLCFQDFVQRRRVKRIHPRRGPEVFFIQRRNSCPRRKVRV